MNNILTEIIDLYRELEIKSRKLNLDNKNIVNCIRKSILERSAKIKEICEVEKYDLYFNVVVGVEKTTFMYTLLNLLDNKYFSLLTTDSRRITVYEVKIKFNKDKSKVYLESMKKEEFDCSSKKENGFISRNKKIYK